VSTPKVFRVGVRVFQVGVRSGPVSGELRLRNGAAGKPAAKGLQRARSEAAKGKKERLKDGNDKQSLSACFSFGIVISSNQS
jgi:hypothetical protein